MDKIKITLRGYYNPDKTETVYAVPGFRGDYEIKQSQYRRACLNANMISGDYFVGRTADGSPRDLLVRSEGSAGIVREIIKVNHQ